jgi:phospholipid/cholesterol/gamma-HCH transport system substrate-binding protein
MTAGESRFRYTNEAVGGAVLLVAVIFIAVAIYAGRVREWFSPVVQVKVLMPEQGLFGLAEGSKIEVLGTQAGEVRRIVIDPNQRIFAEARIHEGMMAFIRRDSRVVIRKRFGVAGASYLHVIRGFGQPLDKEFPVLEAETESVPVDDVGELIEELRNRVLPILDGLQRTVGALAVIAENLSDPEGNLGRILASLRAVAERLERGDGSLGRLLTEEQVALEMETLLGTINTDLGRLSPILEGAQAMVRDVARLAETLGTQSDAVPRIIRRVDTVLITLQEMLTDLSEATPDLPRIGHNVAKATDELPLLLLQTEQTLAELDKLLRRLRSSWLLGGRRAQDRDEPVGRLPALEIRPYATQRSRLLVRFHGLWPPC